MKEVVRRFNDCGSAKHCTAYQLLGYNGFSPKWNSEHPCYSSLTWECISTVPRKLHILTHTFFELSHWNQTNRPTLSKKPPYMLQHPRNHPQPHANTQTHAVALRKPHTHEHKKLLAHKRLHSQFTAAVLEHYKQSQNSSCPCILSCILKAN